MVWKKSAIIVITLLLASAIYLTITCLGTSQKLTGELKKKGSQKEIAHLIKVAEKLIDEDKLDQAYHLLDKDPILQSLDPKSEAAVLILKGRTFFFRNECDKALPYYFNALEQSRSIRDSVHIGAAYYDIACVFNLVKDYDKAIKFADSITIYDKSLQSKIFIGGLKTNIYSLSRRYSKAVESGVEVLKLMKNGDEDRARRMVILSIIAESYLNLGKPEIGKPYLDQALLLAPYVDSPYDKAEIDITRAGYANSSEKYREAISYISYLIEKGVREDIVHMLSGRVYKRLSDAYAGLGFYQKAYEFEDKATKKFLNLKNEADFYAVARKDAEHYLLEKDHVIAVDKRNLLEQNKKLQTRTVVAIVLGLFIFLLAVLIALVRANYKSKNKLFEERIRSQESERLVKEQESNLSLLEAGIQGEERERERIAQELHDSVAGELMVMKLNLKSLEKQGLYTGKNQLYYQLIEQTGEIAEKIRTTAHNLMPTKLSKNGLFESIKSFLDGIRSDDIKFEGQFYGTMPRVKKQVEKIIFFVILELIQNIIKHSEALSALVQLSIDNDILAITVEDSGIGYKDAPEKNKKGLGINKIKEQVKVLEGTIDISGEKGIGTTIFIEIPLEKYKLSD